MTTEQRARLAALRRLMQNEVRLTEEQLREWSDLGDLEQELPDEEFWQIYESKESA